MANYATLKAAVQAVVKSNGNKEITGTNMQSTLLGMITSLASGYLFKGVATPSTSPGTPDENVFYLTGAGTFANMGSTVTIPVGSIGVFKYNGSWSSSLVKIFEGIDNTPTGNSDNPVKSGGVYDMVTTETDLSNMIISGYGLSTSVGSAPSTVGSASSAYIILSVKHGEIYKVHGYAGSSRSWAKMNNGIVTEIINNDYVNEKTLFVEVDNSFNGLAISFERTNISTPAIYLLEYVNMAVKEAQEDIAEVNREMVESTLIQRKGYDLFNKKNILSGYAMTTSGLVKKDGTFVYMIPVNHDYTYVYSTKVAPTGTINAFLDSSRELVSGSNFNNRGTIETGRDYLVVTCLLTDINGLSIWYGNELQTTPRAYNPIQGYLPTARQRVTVFDCDFITPSPNIVSPDITFQGWSIRTDTASTSYYSSSPIPVKPNTTYYSNVSFRWCTLLASYSTFGDGAKYDALLENVTSFTTSADDCYVRVQFAIGTDPTTLMITEGSLPSEFKPYGGQLISGLTGGSPSSETKKHIKIAFMGSSTGVNTIQDLPFILDRDKIDLTIVNLFVGSATLEDWADLCGVSTQVNAGVFISTSSVWSNMSMSVDEMLDYAEWNYIIIQRGVAEATTFTSTQSAALNDIIGHIRQYTDYNPIILFNSGFDRPKNLGVTRQQQIDNTKDIMITAKNMQDEFGIEVIPTGIAIQNARNTILANYGTYSSQSEYYGGFPDLACDQTHLDVGIGSYITAGVLYEFIVSRWDATGISANKRFPTEAEATSRTSVTTVADTYTPASDVSDYYEIANSCILAAIRSPWQLSKVLPVKYVGSEDPSQWDLDIDYQ